MIGVSTSHLVLIPSYNPGRKVSDTVRSAHARWNPVWMMVDGGTGNSTERLRAMVAQDPGLWVIALSRNRGKGVVVLAGLETTAAAGFTCVLTMDTDGQYPASLTPEFIAASQTAPDAMILGQPVSSAVAPQMHMQGRRLSNGCTDTETLWAGIGGTLFGFRVYPIAPLAEVICQQSWIRGFDFDPEAAVYLCWAGVHPIRLAAPARYFRPNGGGASHFQYLHDNTLLIAMYLCLVAEGLLRLPSTITRRLQHGW